MMVMIILYVRQQKIHRYIEQSFGLCGRGRWEGDVQVWDHINTCGRFMSMYVKANTIL